MNEDVKRAISNVLILILGVGRKKRIINGNKQKAYEEAANLKREILRESRLCGELRVFSDVLDYYEMNHLKYRKSYQGCMQYVRKLKNDLGKVPLKNFTVENELKNHAL